VVYRLSCIEIPVAGGHSPKTGRSAQKKKKKREVEEEREKKMKEERRKEKTCALI